MWTCNCHFPGISREGHVCDNHENFSFCRELMEEGSCICLFLKKKSCYWSVFNSLSKEHLQQRQKEEHSFTFTPNLGLELCSTSQTPLSFDKISGELQKHNKEGTREKCHHHLQKTGECGILKIPGSAFHNVHSVPLQRGVSPLGCSLEQTRPFLLFKAGLCCTLANIVVGTMTQSWYTFLVFV